jgi:16S rRNA (cytosine1402-N4)-methyltransferase
MHTSVLLDEAIEELKVSKGEKYIDATYGGGGHSREIVRRGGKVLAIDVDVDAVARLSPSEEDNIRLVRGNFEDIEEIACVNGFVPVRGILFDLGLSSFELSDAKRGFSFMLEGPLDMRFDQSSNSMQAGELIDALNETALERLFRDYGDEPHARVIARKIKKIQGDRVYWTKASTLELARVIESCVGRRGRLHPATKVFQALRMAVNDELGVLTRGLESAFELLDDGGRIVVISFHSGEDRIVKKKFKEWSDSNKGIICGRVLMPNADEVALNPRARSARMRVFEKERRKKDDL